MLSQVERQFFSKVGNNFSPKFSNTNAILLLAFKFGDESESETEADRSQTSEKAILLLTVPFEKHNLMHIRAYFLCTAFLMLNLTVVVVVVAAVF